MEVNLTNLSLCRINFMLYFFKTEVTFSFYANTFLIIKIIPFLPLLRSVCVRHKSELKIVFSVYFCYNLCRCIDRLKSTSGRVANNYHFVIISRIIICDVYLLSTNECNISYINRWSA